MTQETDQPATAFQTGANALHAESPRTRTTAQQDATGVQPSRAEWELTEIRLLLTELRDMQASFYDIKVCEDGRLARQTPSTPDVLPPQ